MRWASPPGRFATDPAQGDSVLMATEGTSGVTGTGTVTADTSWVRNAAPASIRHASGASGGAAYQQWTWGLQGAFGWRVRRYFIFSGQWPGNIGGGNKSIFQVTDNGAKGVYVRLVDATKKLRLATFDGTTEVQQGADSATVIQLNRLYRIEVYGKNGSGAGQSECAMVVADATNEVLPGWSPDPGEMIGPFTGLTVSTANITGALFGFVDSADAGAVVNTCDGAINNDQGAVQTGFPGPCLNVLYSLPTADSAVGADWKDGAGGGSNIFGGVDNTPPVGVADGSSTAASQIKNANTADAVQNYDAVMQSYAAAGLAIGQYPSVVQSLVAVGSSTATNVTFGQLMVSNPVQPGGEDVTTSGRSAAVAAFGQNWRAVWGTPQFYPSLTMIDPAAAPVMRVGRRGTEAGTLEFSLMAIVFEVAPSMPSWPSRSLPMLSGP